MITKEDIIMVKAVEIKATGAKRVSRPTPPTLKGMNPELVTMVEGLSVLEVVVEDLKVELDRAIMEYNGCKEELFYTLVDKQRYDLLQINAKGLMALINEVSTDDYH